MDEIWKDIPDTNYSASNLGRIASRWYGDLRILRPGASGGGYLFVNLYMGGSHRTHYVHRLVASAFLGEPPTQKHQVNHKNGIRTDNLIENLEWVTASENRIHRYQVLKHGAARGEAHSRVKLTEAQVREIRARAVPGAPKDDLAREFGVAKVTIYQIVGRRKWGWLV